MAGTCIPLFLFDSEEICREIKFLPSGEKLSILDRVKTSHYTFLQNSHVRLHGLGNEDIAEVVTIKKPDELNIEAMDFFSSLKKSAISNPDTMEEVVKRHLQPQIASFLSIQSHRKFPRLIDVLAALVIEHKSTEWATYIKQAMQTVAILFCKPYFDKSAIIEMNGYFDIFAPANCTAVFCLSHKEVTDATT